jgi:hypothetical protein
MTTIINGSSPSITFSDTTTQTTAFTTDPIVNNIKSQAATPLTFAINATEAMRVNASGNFMVGTTSVYSGSRVTMQATWPQNILGINVISSNPSAAVQIFAFNSSDVGSVVCSATTTTYNTSSDYRLKENIAPMTDALNLVDKLKPVTYTWKINGSNGQGFIAHELQEIVPECVTGKKDAVNDEGKPIHQGIDTSFLVATLVAAIQELNAKVIALTLATPTEAQVTAKQSAIAKLAALGLTEDEIKALVG